MTAENVKKVLPRITPAPDSFWMGMAFMYAAICKDPEEQRAAIVVDTSGAMLGQGVNFIPHKEHISANWDKKNRKRLLVLAEELAIDRACRTKGGVFELNAATLYVTGPIGVRTYRRVLWAGIKNVIFGPQVPPDYDEVEFKDVLAMAKDQFITVKAFEGNINWLRDRVMRLEDTLL